MKRTLLTILSISMPILMPAGIHATGVGDDQAEDRLTVLCYDSFSSEWGPGPAIAEAFREQHGIDVVFQAPGDAVMVLNQLLQERQAPSADVVIGLDDSLLDRVIAGDLLEPYDSPMLDVVPDRLLFDSSRSLLPFDYGYFAICYDSQTVQTVPASLEDLTSPVYRGSLILMDPRTSSPGLGFLLWTVAVYGERWPDYWKRLRPSIVTITDGWSQAYTLFLEGEGSLVLSYATSPVYHVEYERNNRYRAAEFSDGHPIQIEGMGIVAGTPRRETAEAFIDFMLSDRAQFQLAMANIMMPVNPGVELPESFDWALIPGRVVGLEAARSMDPEELIQRWLEVFGN